MNTNSPKFRDFNKTMNVTMTGILDADREILLNVDDRELMAICIPPKNRYTRKLCDENFFRNRVVKYFNITNKPADLTWKKVYVTTRLLTELGISSPESIKLYLSKKNQPIFITGNLLEFLKNLRHQYGNIGKELYNIIYEGIEYGITTMEIVFRIIIMIKTLKMGSTPTNILSDIVPTENWDPTYLAYTTNPEVITAFKQFEKEVIKIYVKVLREQNLYNFLPDILERNY